MGTEEDIGDGPVRPWAVPGGSKLTRADRRLMFDAVAAALASVESIQLHIPSWQRLETAAKTDAQAANPEWLKISRRFGLPADRPDDVVKTIRERDQVTRTSAPGRDGLSFTALLGIHADLLIRRLEEAQSWWTSACESAPAATTDTAQTGPTAVPAEQTAAAAEQTAAPAEQTAAAAEQTAAAAKQTAAPAEQTAAPAEQKAAAAEQTAAPTKQATTPITKGIESAAEGVGLVTDGHTHPADAKTPAKGAVTEADGASPPAKAVVPAATGTANPEVAAFVSDLERLSAALGGAMQHSLFLTFLSYVVNSKVGESHTIEDHCDGWGLSDDQVNTVWLWLTHDPLSFGGQQLPVAIDKTNRRVYRKAPGIWRRSFYASAVIWGGALVYGVIVGLFAILHSAGVWHYPSNWGWKLLVLVLFVLIGAWLHLGAKALNVNYDNPISVYEAGSKIDWLALRWLGVLQMYIPVGVVVASLWGAGNIPTSFQKLGTAILAGYSADSFIAAAVSKAQNSAKKSPAEPDGSPKQPAGAAA